MMKLPRNHESGKSTKNNNFVFPSFSCFRDEKSAAPKK